MATTGPRPRVLIIGGGFGGLYAARALGKAPVDVTVIDRTNHHVFQPLLYQVATATLNPTDIAARLTVRTIGIEYGFPGTSSYDEDLAA